MRGFLLGSGDNPGMFCPYGQPGDRLWVRETWRPEIHDANGGDFEMIGYKETDTNDACMDVLKRDLCEWRKWCSKNGDAKWYPSIHMPRWASRITLEVTGVRVERVQDLSEADARAEGCTHTGIGPLVSADEIETARDQFARLWDSIHAARGYSWASNPYVWVVEFRRVTP
jgi:hypothetical protein